ncbi:TPA: hypothetical protein ACS777_003597 [Providencia alcalifaciens]
MPPINTQDSIFHDGDPTTGQLGTIVTALWLNNVQAATRDVQAEIKSVLAKAGMTPDPKKTNQLADAISQIVSSGNYASTAYVDNGLNKKIDKANISGVKGNDNDKVPSLNLFTTETGKLATKAELTSGLAGKQPAGDYTTKDELKTGLDSKLGTDAIVQSGGVNEDVVMSQKAVTDAINKKPDVTQTTGASTTLVMSQNAVTEITNKKVDKSNAEINNTLTITSSSDYATIHLKKTSGDSFSIETAPDALNDAVKFFYQKSDKTESFSASLRKKSGVIALVSDIPESITKVEDVTSQRSVDVTYVNSNSHTIFVMLESYGSVSQAGIFTVDGISMTWITSGAQYGNVTSATIPVPAGSSYSANAFKKWVEIS